jgi:hypothetical protein
MNHLAFVMVMHCVFFEVEMKFSGCLDNIIPIILMKALAHLPCLSISKHQKLPFQK